MGVDTLTDEKIPASRLWAWLAAAMSAPLAHFSGGSWLGLLAAGLACWGVYGLMCCPGRTAVPGSRLLCALQMLWLWALLGTLIPDSAAYWPGKASGVVVPLTLLALGALGCCRRASRVAGVLFWTLVVMYIPIFLTGAKDVRLQWLLPQGFSLSWGVLPVLLLPFAALALPRQGREAPGRYGWLLALGVGLFMVTAGVLSPAAAQKAETPFRELSRSLALGAVSRFESLVSVAVTFGWYALASLLVECACTYGTGARLPREYCAWGTALAAAALVFLGLRLPSWLAAAGSVFFWIVLPAASAKKFWKKKKKPLDKR